MFLTSPETERLEFHASEPLTLGVETEVQLVDWKTLELCPAAPRLLGVLDDPAFHPEYFRSNLEIVTGVCASVSDVETDLKRSYARLLQAAERQGVEVVGVGTHPLDGAHCDSPLFPCDRYLKVHKRSRWAASFMSTFGLHVHVGMPDEDQAIALMKGALPFLAHLLALSASSPFAAGKDTGLCSCRVTVYETMPTAGTPPELACWEDFERMVTLLKSCQAIESLKDLLWDIRPNPTLGTVEVRICDGASSLDDTLAMVAAVRGLFAWLTHRWRRGEELPTCPEWRLRENKWRAARDGMQAVLVVDNEGRTRPVAAEWQDLLEAWGALIPAEDRDRIREALARGPSCDRQRNVFADSGSLLTVLSDLAHQWREGALS